MPTTSKKAGPAEPAPVWHVLLDFFHAQVLVGGGLDVQ